MVCKRFSTRGSSCPCTSELDELQELILALADAIGCPINPADVPDLPDPNQPTNNPNFTRVNTGACQCRDEIDFLQDLVTTITSCFTAGGSTTPSDTFCGNTWIDCAGEAINFVCL